MKVSRSRLFALALEDFIQRRNNQLLLEEINRAHMDEPDLEEKRTIQKNATDSTPYGQGGMVIHQGELYWVDLGDPHGSEPAQLHPYIVIQNDLFNESMIRTVVVCALTSNLRRGKSPGNVLLQPGEGNLPKQSVVNVSQVFTVDKQMLVEKIGSLSRKRIREILDGLQLLTEPRDID